MAPVDAPCVEGIGFGREIDVWGKNRPPTSAVVRRIAYCRRPSRSRRGHLHPRRDSRMAIEAWLEMYFKLEDLGENTSTTGNVSSHIHVTTTPFPNRKPHFHKSETFFPTAGTESFSCSMAPVDAPCVEGVGFGRELKMMCGEKM